MLYKGQGFLWCKGLKSLRGKKGFETWSCSGDTWGACSGGGEGREGEARRGRPRHPSKAGRERRQMRTGISRRDGEGEGRRGDYFKEKVDGRKKRKNHWVHSAAPTALGRSGCRGKSEEAGGGGGQKRNTARV